MANSVTISSLNRALQLLFSMFFAISVGYGESIRIASYNLNNYLIQDRYYKGTFRKDYPKPEAEKKMIRKVIRGAAADVLALQEVGGPSFLNELKLDLAHEGLNYPYMAILKREGEARALAFLSRLPLEETDTQETLDFKYLSKRTLVKRGLLGVKINAGESSLYVYNVHLKSRYQTEDQDPESAIRRNKEARVIRDYLRARFDDSDPLLLIGDLNDNYLSASIQRFRQIGDRHFLHEIPLVDKHDTQWTYYNRKRRSYEQVDYVFASKALLGFTSSAGIWDASEQLKGSDHRLIYLDIEVPQVDGESRE